MATKIVNVSELKTRVAALLRELEVEGAPVYVTQHGKPKAVLVQYREYEALLRKMEDLEDLLAMKQALTAPDQEALSLAEYERQRAANFRG